MIWCYDGCFNGPELQHHRLANTNHLTLKMNSAQVVETPVTNNSSFQNWPSPGRSYYTKLQICRLFCFQNVPFGAGSDPTDIAATPVSRHSKDNSTAICFWDVYYSCSFCFTKVYRKLIKITTNSFSLPQVQVVNSSQKPSKLLMRWIYGRYYCAWPPEYSPRGYHQHEKIKFVSLSSHTTSWSLHWYRWNIQI